MEDLAGGAEDPRIVKFVSSEVTTVTKRLTGCLGPLLYWSRRFCHGLLVTRWSLLFRPDSSPPFLPAV